MHLLSKNTWLGAGFGLALAIELNEFGQTMRYPKTALTCIFASALGFRCRLFIVVVLLNMLFASSKASDIQSFDLDARVAVLETNVHNAYSLIAICFYNTYN